MMVKDLLAVVTFKNGLLRDAMETSGLSCKEVAALAGINRNYLYALGGLRINPYKKGSLTPIKAAAAIAEVLDKDVGEIFPPSLYVVDIPRRIEKRYDSLAVISLLEAKQKKLLKFSTHEGEDFIQQNDVRRVLDEAMGTLIPRHEKILKMRFGLDGDGAHTLGEVADAFAVTPERIRQIEGRALRQLRHPDRSVAIKEAM